MISLTLKFRKLNYKIERNKKITLCELFYFRNFSADFRA